MASRPSWIGEITQRYGSFIQFSNTFSFQRVGEVVRNPVDVFRRDSPALIRVDITYGRGSSVSWLYDLLQSMFIFLGVTDDKFSKEQVYVLAQTIASQYKTLKVAEIMLFVSRFMAGKYGRFYGGDSYALVVTEALNTFLAEREHYYADLEREKQEKAIEDGKKGTITYEEYKRMKAEKGEQVSGALEAMFGNQ